MSHRFGCTLRWKDEVLVIFLIKILGDDLYHTNCNPYHTYKNGFITHGVYHIDFSKRVKNRVITQLK